MKEDIYYCQWEECEGALVPHEVAYHELTNSPSQ